MLKRSAFLLLLICFLPGLGFAQHFDPKDLQVRNLLLEVFQKTPSPHQRTAKLEEILKISPENYYALVKMGELEQGRGRMGVLKAREYFLRAALQQPNSPEAYLCLAQSYYQSGEVHEGNSYMKMALRGPYGKLSYEGVCLRGQSELDTCNYSAAVVTFGNAALSNSSPYRNDPLLLRQLYYAAGMSRPISWRSRDYWIPYIYAKLISQSVGAYGVEDERVYQQLLKEIRRLVESLRAQAPHLSPQVIENLLSRYLYHQVMGNLRRRIGETRWMTQGSGERFELSKIFYNFGVCPTEEVTKLQPDLDLYNVFIEASVRDPKEQARIKKVLAEKRDEALDAVARVDDPMEKGRRLFSWLRENLIKDYDAVDGVTAEGVADKNKYLCLSGAIVYTLVGRDAGLDVNGFIMPGHAFAVLHDKGKQINVETTYPVRESAEFPAGFDSLVYSAGSRGATLRAQAHITGEVSPIDLVSYQFINVGLNKLDNLTLNKYANLMREVLKEMGFTATKIAEVAQSWRNATLGGGQQYALMATMSTGTPDSDTNVKRQAEKYHKELMGEVDLMMADLGRGRAFNPFNQELLRAIENITQLYSHLVCSRPASAMVRRLQKKQDEERRVAKKEMEKTVKEETSQEAKAKDEPAAPAAADKKDEKKQEPAPEIKAATEEAPAQPEDQGDEETREWRKEKQVWIHSLRKLEDVTKAHPCSDRLKRELAQHCMSVVKVLSIAKKLNTVREQKEKMDYNDVVQELYRVKTAYFDDTPDLSVPLTNAMQEAL